MLSTLVDILVVNNEEEMFKKLFLDLARCYMPLEII